MNFNAPHIDYSGLSPVIALTAGICVVLLVGLIPRFSGRFSMAYLTIAVLAVTAARCIWEWNSNTDLVSGALRLDAFGLAVTLIACFAGAIAVFLSIREPAADEAGHGAFYALLLGSVLGMTLIAQAQNLIAFFVALELLSIPLYVLCASARRTERSLESGLKYLVIGSIGSATVLYGFALLYGGSGSTDFAGIAKGLAGDNGNDTIVLIGTAMVITGMAFKSSLAPFHQWTPDVYQGAPTPITAFMAVATKAAAFIAMTRLFEVALGPIAADWQPAAAAVAVVSIAVGNIGALGQDSLKRLMGYSGIAQAGYILAGVVVATETGAEALVFYLAAYTLMNLAVFAVVIARERETQYGDDIEALAGIGRSRPLLAWPLTIAMLALAGLPGTSGFMGKLFLIEASVDGDYTWLGVAIVIGTMISLAYYLRVVAAVWMRPEPSATVPPTEPGAMPAIAGGSPEADAIPRGASRCGLIVGSALLCGAGTIAFGVAPSPLIDWASHAAHSLTTTL